MRRCFLTGLTLTILFGAGCTGNVRTSPSLAAISNGDSAAQRSRSAAGYIETLLHRFKSSPDAASPEAGLILDASGNLYGTTIGGGHHPACPGGYDTGCGTVFTIDASGKERLLYSFRGKPDASQPFAGLLLKAGNLYGTTASGGNVKPCYVYGGNGCGTVFRVNKSGSEAVVYEFKGNFGSGKGDGQGPMGGLVSDAAGNLYGTTPFGGKYESGTVFEISKTGTETVLYSFTGAADGARPYSGVVRDAAGNLYGVTNLGANSTCTSGCGTVFELNGTGTLTTLYRFKGGKDGGNPRGGLAMDAAGSLYGTAQNYGDLSCNKRGGNPGCGSVFKVDSSGKFTVLHTFAGSPDGATPSESLTLDENRQLYGTTSFGGDNSCNGGYSCGVAFEIDASGTESVLYTFTGGINDGEVPYGGLVRDTTGNLYGTTVSGGPGPCNQGCGVVFKLAPPQTRHAGFARELRPR
ncbi:MAG: choice-of-anchor tandem repeat GloVer-containing protein [Candidatus Tumulicola sp.]